MAKAKMLSVILTEELHDFLLKSSSDLGIKKSEFARLLIEGAYVANAIEEAQKSGNKQESVEIGGYGFNIDFEVIKDIYNRVSESLKETFPDNSLEDIIGKGIKVTRISERSRKIKSNRLKKSV
jgi:hypothetical protein